MPKHASDQVAYSTLPVSLARHLDYTCMIGRWDDEDDPDMGYDLIVRTLDDHLYLTDAGYLESDYKCEICDDGQAEYVVVAQIDGKDLDANFAYVAGFCARHMDARIFMYGPDAMGEIWAVR